MEKMPSIPNATRTKSFYHARNSNVPFAYRGEKKKLKLNGENVSNCGLYLIFLLLVLSAKKNRPRFSRTTTTKNTQRIYREFVLRIESVPLILIEMPLIKWTIT